MVNSLSSCREDNRQTGFNAGTFLIKGQAQKCEHASDKAIKVALSIKFPSENIIIPLIMLAVLFGGMAPKLNSSSRTIEVEVEVEMQDVMAEALEDVRLDNGVIKIGSDDKYQ